MVGEDFLIKLPKNLKELAKLLDGKLYVVGGTVRNALLKLPLGDIDITGEYTPSVVKEKLSGSDFAVIDDYASFGTLLIKKGAESYEYTSFRTDSYLNDHRPKSVTFTSDIKVDATRRDFTVNAIYYNVLDKKLCDPLNGLEDIRNKVLRAANGEKTFEEDGLRVLRLIRLYGELGFSVSEETFFAAKKNAKKIEELSSERISSELNKILLCDIKYGEIDFERVYETLKLMEDVGALSYIFSDLQQGRGLKQNEQHHKYDVLDHSFYAAAYAKPSIRLYALLHDIGKPKCFNEYGNYHKHDEIGSEIAARELRRLRYPRLTVQRAERLIKEHMKDLLGDMKERKLRLFFVKNSDILDDLISLKIADGYASGMNDGYSVTVKRWVELLKEMKEEKIPFSVKELNIGGMDVISVIGSENAKYTSKVLERLLEKVVTKEIKNEKSVLTKYSLSAFKEIKNAND